MRGAAPTTPAQSSREVGRPLEPMSNTVELHAWSRTACAYQSVGTVWYSDDRVLPQRLRIGFTSLEELPLYCVSRFFLFSEPGRSTSNLVKLVRYLLDVQKIGVCSDGSYLRAAPEYVETDGRARIEIMIPTASAVLHTTQRSRRSSLNATQTCVLNSASQHGRRAPDDLRRPVGTHCYSVPLSTTQYHSLLLTTTNYHSLLLTTTH